jgi:purine nucleoside phosphorylase
MGADAATMSSFPELVAARRLSLEAASLSWITNWTASVSGDKTEHGHVVESGALGVPSLRAILSALVRERRNA